MKYKLKRVYMAVILATVATGMAWGFNGALRFTMRPQPVYNSGDPLTEEDDLPGNRQPNKPVACTIDPEEGIQFVGMEKPEILSYEIYDLSGACAGVFGDEDSFLDYLFFQTGEFQIRLLTADWAFVGYIEL